MEGLARRALAGHCMVQVRCRRRPRPAVVAQRRDAARRMDWPACVACPALLLPNAPRPPLAAVLTPAARSPPPQLIRGIDKGAARGALADTAAHLGEVLAPRSQPLHLLWHFIVSAWRGRGDAAEAGWWARRLGKDEQGGQGGPQVGRRACRTRPRSSSHNPPPLWSPLCPSAGQRAGGARGGGRLPRPGGGGGAQPGAGPGAPRVGRHAPAGAAAAAGLGGVWAGGGARGRGRPAVAVRSGRLARTDCSAAACPRSRAPLARARPNPNPAAPLLRRAPAWMPRPTWSRPSRGWRAWRWAGCARCTRAGG